jgi:glycosyltransferase involved in cell wall biosynthesis
MPSIGIVIPARNEEELLPVCLESMQHLLDQSDELLVVDAASEDDTAQIARRMGFRVINSDSSSRGKAVGLGVDELLALEKMFDVIMIVHADMVIPHNTRQTLLMKLSQYPDAPGGSLGHHIDERGLAYRLLELGNNFRARFFRFPYGDQAQFFCPISLNDHFVFPHQEILEDVELSLLLRKRGSLLYVDCPVLISSRHWKHGFIRTTLRNWLIVLSYLLRRIFSASSVA